MEPMKHYIIQVFYGNDKPWYIIKPGYVSTRKSEALQYSTRELAAQEARHHKTSEIVEVETQSDVPFNQYGLGI